MPEPVNFWSRWNHKDVSPERQVLDGGTAGENTERRDVEVWVAAVIAKPALGSRVEATSCPPSQVTPGCQMQSIGKLSRIISTSKVSFS